MRLSLLLALPILALFLSGGCPGTGKSFYERVDERIRKIRMADISISFTASGVPLPNKAVRVQMTKHLFPFGTAVDMVYELEKEEPTTYKAKLEENFNSATPYQLGWWGNYNRNFTWLTDRGFKIHGHLLVMPCWSWSDPNVSHTDSALATTQVKTRVDWHTNNFKGRLQGWDVLNDAIRCKEFQGLMGDESQADWFKWAKAQDSDAALYINEGAVLPYAPSHPASKLSELVGLVASLQELGAPVEGIGLQAHMQAVNPPIEMIHNTLDRIGSLGLPIRISEFDVNTGDETYQAEFTKEFLRVAFAHPSVVGFTMWGFWESKHWIPRAAMYRSDWTAKPNLAAYQELVLGEWWTDENLTTSSTGSISTRVFKGDYTITVDTEGGPVRFNVPIHSDNTIELEVDSERLRHPPL